VSALLFSHFSTSYHSFDYQHLRNLKITTSYKSLVYAKSCKINLLFKFNEVFPQRLHFFSEVFNSFLFITSLSYSIYDLEIIASRQTPINRAIITLINLKSTLKKQSP